MREEGEGRKTLPKDTGPCPEPFRWGRGMGVAFYFRACHLILLGSIMTLLGMALMEGGFFQERD